MSATLYEGISQLVQPNASEGDTREPLCVTPDAALVVRDDKIVAIGPRNDVNQHPGAKDAIRHDLGGRAVIPGLVDSHTHVVFAGSRMDEMAMRTRGETYESIARAGGGIVRSVDALEQTSIDELVASAKVRIEQMMARGTTTVEMKTGYGLRPELELKQLEAICAVAAEVPIAVYATVLAHVIPKDQRDDRAGYIQSFCDDVLTPAAENNLVRFCDVFVEATAFVPDEARVIAARAKALGLDIKLHVDQLHDGGGAQLAAELGALSADHLEMTQASGAKALAEAGVVATVLPGCGLFLGGNPWPDARRLRDAGCEVCVATDCNPGSSMVTDLGLCATLAATQCGLSLEEALWGITQGGAKALGLTDRGKLSPGQRADFVVLNDPDWRSMLYYPAAAPIHQVVAEGKVVASS